MKPFYTLTFLLSSVLLFGCSKDFLKSYDNRIVGTWRITDVNRVGLGGNTDRLTFRDGTFTFYKNGRLEYVNAANARFKGSWDIAPTEVNDQTYRRLQVTAIDFNSQEVLTENFDQINFVGTNHFKATISSGLHVYVTHFRR